MVMVCSIAAMKSPLSVPSKLLLGSVMLAIPPGVLQVLPFPCTVLFTEQQLIPNQLQCAWSELPDCSATGVQSVLTVQLSPLVSL